MCTVDRKENIDSVLQREYSVENVLGTGGFGTVYSGIRKQDNRPVSLSRSAILVLLLLSMHQHIVYLTQLFYENQNINRNTNSGTTETIHYICRLNLIFFVINNL